MMKHIFTCLLVCLIGISAMAQNTPAPQQIARPKLVVGIVIDQMRWDFLYRYYDHYGNDGFKRLLREGFSCENTMVPYTPTVTAAGHTCIYTGSVPAITGITGNNWWDADQGKRVYCTDDSTFETVGAADSSGRMSPNNMLVTTVTDELRLATNFKSKVIGVAIKDRGSILPAGHAANGAYWYDDQSGKWVTSSYYMSALPGWVDAFNNRKIVDSLVTNWQTLNPAATYTESSLDNEPYEKKFPGEPFPTFPHKMSSLTESQKDTAIKSLPAGNTMTLQFARSAIEGESLGMGSSTDFLAVSCSSTDYIGHQFGPNSVENEDDYLRLDADLGSFFTYLDGKYGAGNYLLFLTADHGVAHIPAYLQENKIPAGFLNTPGIAYYLNANAKATFGLKGDVVVAEDNYQFTFNQHLLDSAKISRQKMMDFMLPLLKLVPGIANEFDITKLNDCTLPDVQKKMFSNGYYAKRCGDIQVIFQPGWIDGDPAGTTHGLWNPYDAHIPLLWFGWGIKQGATNREVYMTDIAPTVSALLHIQMPSGCVGKVIGEVMK